MTTEAVYIIKAEERLGYIDHMLRVEHTKEVYDSAGERTFWEIGRLWMEERAESERHWRDWVRDGDCGYDGGQGF